MKHNLKNRPKIIAGDDVSMRIVKPYEEWFEGFEAELREIENEEAKYGVTRLYNLVMEILGDE